MILLSILLCLALQRFANMGGFFQESWFELYLKSMNPWVVKLNEWVAVLLLIVPVLLFLALLHFLFAGKLFGLSNLILATIVLLVCIDARDFKNKLAVYFYNLEKNDIQAAANSVTSFLGDISSNNTAAELNRAVTKAILLKSFERLFAGLFWFMILGGYGVTTYFLIALLQKTATKADPNYAGLAKVAARLQDILDWIPSRLIGLSYSLVGNFNKGFSYCRNHLWSSLTEVKKFTVDSGIATLDLDPDITKATPLENYAALDLINRVLIIWLIALFLVLLGILI